MSKHLLFSVLGPLLGLFIISLGNGFISSITSLKLDAEGTSDVMIGFVSSCYFIGLALGAIFSDRLILRIGHIRAYSGFASLTAITFLLQGLYFDPWFWACLRLVNGWAIIGIFLIVESWLLLSSDQKMRGRLLAIYMIAFYGSGMFGQISLGIMSEWDEMIPFVLAGILGSLSVLPMVILPRISPEIKEVRPLGIKALFDMSPTGVMACFVSGITIAAVYALFPIYFQRMGLNIHQVGQLMACVILGAMVLQYPIGRWSDHQDRQVVLISLSIFCAVLTLGILFLPATHLLLMVLFFLIGGGIFAVYPVAVSHATDRATIEQLIPSIQGLLLINSIGSVFSPFAISALMSVMGNKGLFWVFFVINIALAIFLMNRRQIRPAPEPVAPFVTATQMSPIGAEIRITEQLEQATIQQREANTDESNTKS